METHQKLWKHKCSFGPRTRLGRSYMLKKVISTNSTLLSAIITVVHLLQLSVVRMHSFIQMPDVSENLHSEAWVQKALCCLVHKPCKRSRGAERIGVCCHFMYKFMTAGLLFSSNGIVWVIGWKRTLPHHFGLTDVVCLIISWPSVVDWGFPVVMETVQLVWIEPSPASIYLKAPGKFLLGGSKHILFKSCIALLNITKNK